MKKNIATEDSSSLPTNTLNQMRTIVLRDVHTKEIFDLKRKIHEEKFSPKDVVIVLAKICDENKKFLSDGDAEGVLQKGLSNGSTLLRAMTRKSTVEFLKTFDTAAVKKMEDYHDKLLVVVLSGKTTGVFVA